MDLPRFRPRMSRQEKVRRSSSIIGAAPELLRRQLVQSIRQSGDINRLLNESREMQREVCSHAALATFLDQSLRIQYGIALYKTEEKHHDLILTTLSNDSCSHEALSDFLVEVEFDGIESAVVQVLEHDDVQVFPRPDKPVCNKHEGSRVVSEYLLEVAIKSKVGRNRLLATKWLPYYVNGVDSCIAMLEQLLHHYDAEVRGLAALHISYFNCDYPHIEALLWKPVEHETWCGREYVSVNGMKGALQKLILQRLIDLACEKSEAQSRKDSSDGWAKFWFHQMTLTARADRRSFEETVARFYSSIYMSPPSAVLWFDSPRAASLAAALYFHSTQPTIDLRKGAAFSQPHRYISKLIDRIERFPDFSTRCREHWNFGRKNWLARREYEDDRFTPCCGTHLIGLPPSRDRHVWDVISDYNHPLPDELKSVTDSLRNGVQGIDVPDINVPDIDVDSSTSRYFMTRFMDHARLGMVGYRSVLRQVGACPHIYDGLEQLLQICPTFVAFDDLVIASERPTKIRRDSQERLHSLDDAPSIEYADVWGVYSIHGITVRPEIILEPESIKIEEIIGEWNLEIRRVMLARYGIEKFITSSGAQFLNEDECGMLYKMPMKYDQFNMVRVVNRTPEPDGTFRTYFIAVPPNTTTAREGVAWSFQMEGAEYHPTIET